MSGRSLRVNTAFGKARRNGTVGVSEAIGGSMHDMTTETLRRVGVQIRQIRKRRNLTLKQISTETGTSVSMLSMLERGVATPSIGTLVAVSSALGMHMSDLFDTADSRRSPVKRLSDQVCVETAKGVIRRLVQNDAQHGLELVVNEYAPGTSSGSAATHHTGTEFGMLLTGTLTVEIDGEEHVLKEGDAISYSSTSPHRLVNHGPSVARAIWINLDA